MIEVEYGDEPIYIDGEHEPDCPSLAYRPPTIEGSAITFPIFVCSGCVRITPA